MPTSYLLAVVGAFVGWFITTRIKPRIPESWHKQLPKIAAVVTSSLTAGIIALAQAWQGQPLTMDVIWMGLSAGALAVVGHAFPELVQGRLKSTPDA